MYVGMLRPVLVSKATGKICLCNILSLATIFFVTLLCTTPAFGVIFVDASAAGGDGSSWGTAYKSLEVAINSSGTNQEFWVAKGTYYPAAPLAPKAGSLFFGGFKGTEGSRGQRNITLYLTYVDGQNILKHVFQIYYSGVRIDGLVIQRGAATGTDGDGAGGGVFVYKVPAVIVDSTFNNNVAKTGGAIYGWEADITVSGSSFVDNHSSIGEMRGGAIWLHKESPEIIDCVFSGNSAGLMGGAIELNNTVGAMVSGSIFSGNSVTSLGEGGGGAISLQWDMVSPEPSVTVDNCKFENNSSKLEGGALYSNRVHVLVSESTFIGNSAVNGGAIMLDYQLSQPSIVKRCLFLENHAVVVNHFQAFGGAICTYVRSIVIENSIFAYNSSENNGGAVRLHAGYGGDYYAGYSAVVKSSTFYANRANNWGGAIANTNLPTLYLYNSILWENQAVETFWSGSEHQASIDVANLSDSAARVTAMTIRYTNMESLDWEHWSVSESHPGSFSLDPLFVDPDGIDGLPGTLDDNFQLQASSPCVDRAEGDFVTECDMDCYPREDLSVANQGIGTPDYADIGALERIENPAISPCESCSVVPPYIPPYVPPYVPPSGDVITPPIMHLLFGQ